jgi:glycosyltransferase involved in cell wall biosynthesis
MIWEKGIKELISGFSLIHNPDILLLIVGWPDLENPRHIPCEFIKSIVDDSKNILFLGKRVDIPELLAASDVFLYPSYYREGIPRSILEALAMSLPIITTDMPGCNLTVENSKNGILIKPRSITEISRGIEYIQKNNLLILGAESRKLAEYKFSDQIIYKNISNLYR